MCIVFDLRDPAVLFTLLVSPTDYSHRVLPAQGRSLTNVRRGGHDVSTLEEVTMNVNITLVPPDDTQYVSWDEPAERCAIPTDVSG